MNDAMKRLKELEAQRRTYRAVYFDDTALTSYDERDMSETELTILAYERLEEADFTPEDIEKLNLQVGTETYSNPW